MRMLEAWTGVRVLAGVLALVAVLPTQQSAPSVVAPQSKLATESCGPPQYCARTDRQTVPYPAEPPSLGPAGSIIVDPDFHSRILRATDASDDPNQPGTPFHTPASGEQNSWNANSTKFYVGDTGGGFWLFDFAPSAMSVHNSGRLKFPWSGLEFSYTRASILYGLTRRNSAFQEYNLSSGKLTTINSFSSCVKVGGGDWGLSLSVSVDDNRLLGVLGPQQDTDYLIYVYDRKQGCRWFNTQTGEIGGQWGPTGRASGSPASFLVHNAEMAKSGEYVAISSQQVRNGLVIWQLDGLNAEVCAGPDYQCLGHSALGYSHMLNSSNREHPVDFLKRPLNDLTARTHIMGQLPPLNGWYDYHLSWNYIDSNDDTPACFSTYHPTNPEGPGAPLLVNGPWENEIDCVSTERAPATVWRFAHTYSTGRGFWASPRGNVSLDGRFYMFTSDWENELGKDPNGRYRTDVFIVELR